MFVSVKDRDQEMERLKAEVDAEARVAGEAGDGVGEEPCRMEWFNDEEEEDVEEDEDEVEEDEDEDRAGQSAKPVSTLVRASSAPAPVALPSRDSVNKYLVSLYRIKF